MTRERKRESRQKEMYLRNDRILRYYPRGSYLRSNVETNWKKNDNGLLGLSF
jgi:hypothetical protein